MEGLRVKLFTFLMSFVTVCVTKVTFCLRAQVKCFHMFGGFFFREIFGTVWYGMFPQRFVVCKFRESSAVKGTLYLGA